MGLLRLALVQGVGVRVRIIIIIHFISGSKAHKNEASKKTEID